MRVFRVLRGYSALFLLTLFFNSSGLHAQSLPFASTMKSVTLNTITNRGVKYGEADGDGFPDFFAINGFLALTSGVDVYLGDSQGEPRSSKWLTGPPANPFSVVVASDVRDVNGDGLSDLVFATSKGSVDVYVSTGKPTQPYTLSASYDLTTRFPVASAWDNYLIGGLVFADVNSDGFFDLIIGGSVTDLWSGLSSTIPCQYAMGTGPGTFGALQNAVVPSGYEANGATLSKWIDADPSLPGKDTVVFITDKIFHPTQHTYPGTASYIETLRFSGGVLSYQGTNSFLFPSGIRPTSYASGDFNGDGIPETVFGGFYGFGSSQWSSIEVFQGTSTGLTTSTTFQLLPISAGPQPIPNQIVDVEIVDLDNDGLKDVAAAMAFGVELGKQNAELYFWEQQSTNSFSFQSYPNNLQLDGMLSIDGENYLVNYGPNRPNPGILEFPNFDLNPFPDLSVSGLTQFPTPTTRFLFMTTAMSDFSSPTYDDYWTVEIGEGSETSEGRVPRTGTFGGPSHIDNPNWGINLNNAPSGHAVMGHAGLVAVNLPVGDWVMPAYFDPLFNSPFFITGGNGPGEGKAAISLPIPNDPYMVGQDFYFTFSVLDMARPNFPYAFADPIYVRTGVK